MASEDWRTWQHLGIGAVFFSHCYSSLLRIPVSSSNCFLYTAVFVKNPGLDFNLVEEENQRGRQRSLSLPLGQGSI